MKEKHLWKYDRLPDFEVGKRPNVLLVGNGVNRPFGTESWKDLINNALSRNKSVYTYEDLEDMTATMQIVVATSNQLGKYEGKNNINIEVQNIAKRIHVTKLKDSQFDLINTILNSPVDAILNTNYSNEFELCASNNDSLYQFRISQRRTKTVKGIEEKFRLYQFSTLGEKYRDKQLWHIHGDISKPSTMVIGHYYYGKLLKQIEERAASCKRNYNIVSKKGKPFQPLSWVDYFLIGDVYILGFGMSLAEQDIWWLLSFKNEHFPETKVLFYEPEKTINKDVKKLLYAYGADPVTDILLEKDDYVSYYKKVLENIGNRITKDFCK